jgi:hypothetical protein
MARLGERLAVKSKGVTVEPHRHRLGRLLSFLLDTWERELRAMTTVAGVEKGFLGRRDA